MAFLARALAGAGDGPTGWMRRWTKGLKPAILVASSGHGQHLPARQGQGATRRRHTLELIVHALSGAPTPLAARLRRRENVTRQS
uniref:Uncharacterized protein n=1 Tax=Oryza meridionalis TaxID=40149 RepID=A0A0E0BXH5_9ORYZ